MSSLIVPSRRSFIAGIASLIAAPAIVRASSLMPVRGIVLPTGGVLGQVLMKSQVDQNFIDLERHIVRYTNTDDFRAWVDIGRLDSIRWRDDSGRELAFPLAK